MGEQFDFQAISGALGLSSSRLHHLFVEQIGCSPGAYLRRIRLDAAALRLRWTQDTVGQISAGLGYASQSSFSHAFVRRFGMTPARFRREFERNLQEQTLIEGVGSVGTRDVRSFRLIAKRYVGDLYAVRKFWADFEKSLRTAGKVYNREIFMGLVYDDPRVTPKNEVRYDCCVTTTDGFVQDDRTLSKHRLHFISTRAGRYGCLKFSGHRDALLATYQHLCGHWAKNSRYTITDDPVIELHERPRLMMPPEDLRLTLMLPLEG